MSKSELYRRLPSVDELLRLPEITGLVERQGHAAVTEAARAVLGRVREEIAAGTLNATGVDLAVSGLTEAIERQLRQALQLSLRSVINATGVVLHTNLGRAPLGKAALDHLHQVASAYSNLEFDIAKGERGKRDVHVQRLFTQLFASQGGGQDSDVPISTIVVNNNAAAVLLGLNTLAEGGEVIVSRGELVEIGGSFRIPEVMAKSGAVLREVGTTNRTRIADYERAINEKTRLLLRVHRSNFQITGFTEQPTLCELVELGRKRGIPVMEDLGSGALVDLRSLGINEEPGVADSLRAGVDVVTYSGDKLLGGPQAGMLSGRRELIARIRANPLFRALRVDKLTYAALEATLLAYVRQDHDSIPALRMLRLSAEEIERRAQAVKETLQSEASRLGLEIVDGRSVVGGGAAPAATLPTRLLALTCEGLSADDLAASLRASDPSIVARVEEGRVLLDLRTVFPEQDGLLARALLAISSKHSSA
ncbi:MAG TPA: L-seryl-tRNA(Sec) selenium transferase [Terriglobales bacterium]|nr:L-seryl-tRNA(Sec) selenium transferase [Terriglobales bacterium]